MRVDVVHRLDSSTPSVNNLRQGLEAADDSWDVHFHSLRPDLPGSTNIVTTIGEYSSVTFRTIREYIRAKNNSDVLVIHKTLGRELINYVFGMNLSESLLTSCDNVVYSTYDGDYVHSKKETNILFENSDLIYATSNRIKNYAKNLTAEQKIAYIPPSVDTDFFHPNSAVPDRLNSEDLVVGWIGNADAHQSNIQELYNWVQDLQEKEITLRLLLGGGSLPQKLEDRFNMLDIRIDLIDYVPWKEVPIVINSFDIGLAPLQNTEFNKARSSEKVREYMSCGTPVIATDVGENRHLIPDEGGILIDSPKEFSTAVDILSEPKKRKKAAKEVRRHTENKYSIPVVAEQIRDRFENL